MIELSYTEQSDFETGRKMAEVDHRIGAAFAVTWQNEPRSRAFWAGYAYGWTDAEEITEALRNPEPEPFVWLDPPSDFESQWELEREYEDLMGY